MNGASASGAPVLKQDGFEQYPEGASYVNPVVLIEPDVFGGDQRVDQLFRQVLIADIGPVLEIVLAQQDFIVGIYFGRKIVLDFSQFLYRGQMTEYTCIYQKEQDAQQCQQPAGYSAQNPDDPFCPDA